MDPAGLLISIATLTIILEDVNESFNAASSTLTSLKTQIKILETSTQRIQEWLHHTPTADQAKIRQSLWDSIATVDDSLSRLRDDLDTITRTGPKAKRMLGRNGSDQWVKAKFVMNEAGLRKHLTDVRECTSLLHFTLNVCQLPVIGVDREVRELELGAQTLRRAQTKTRRERRSLIQAPETQGPEHSDNFNAFMKSVLDAEADLPDDESPTPSDGMSPGTLDMPRGLSNGHAVGATVDELNLPSARNEDIPLPLRQSHTNGIAPESPALEHRASTADSEGLIPAAPSEPAPPPKVIAPVEPALPDPDTPAPLNARRSTLSSPTIIPDATVGLAVQRKVSRKPVGAGRRSVSTYDSMPSSSFAAENVAYAPSDIGRRVSSPDHAFAVAEKLDPVRQSLIAMPTDDYMHVQYDDNRQHDSVHDEIYADSPPVYAPTSPTSPLPMTRMRRAETSRSSVLDDTTPYLIRLVRENRIDDLQYQLQQSTNVNDADPKNGRTPIMEASRFRRWEIARLLVQAQCQMHLKDNDGNTALHHCAKQGDADICQMLIDGGAQTAECNHAGRTPLEIAAAGGHVEAVLCLLNNMPARKSNDTTVLNAFYEAVKLGDVNTVQVFMAKEVKPKKIKESWKCVCFAAQSGSIAMLELMLAQKCPLKDRSPAGWTALHFAARHDRQPMVDRLLGLKMSWKAQTKKTEETALHIACVHGYYGLAMSLIAHKEANVTMRDADGLEPIHHAVRNGDMKLVTALLDHGANLKDGNKYGWKPIHLATAYGHMALVAEMMTRGISLEEKLSSPSFKAEKKTNEAARRGYWAEIRWPHPSARPLHLALEFGHDDIANMLISGGAKVDECDSNDWRPIHYAAFNCRPDILEVLLAKGATPDAKTDDGHTPLKIGFREYGLTADQAQRDRVIAMLSVAMATRKKSMFGQMTSQLTGSLPSLSSAPKTSKLAAQRNATWHKAQLAESLYKNDNASEGEDDDSLSAVDSATQSSSIVDEGPSLPAEKSAD